MKHKTTNPLDELIVLDFSKYWGAVRNKRMTIRTLLWAAYRYGNGAADIAKLPRRVQRKIELAKKRRKKENNK